MTNKFFYNDYEKIVKKQAYSYQAAAKNNNKKSVLSFTNLGATSLFATVEDLAIWSMNFSSNVAGDKDIIDKMNRLAVIKIRVD